jgi:hypothetical protein
METKGRKNVNKSNQDKVKGIFSWHLVVWPALTWVILSGLCYWLDKPKTTAPAGFPTLTLPTYKAPTLPTFPTLPSNALGEAPQYWVIIAAGILYIVGIWIMYQHAKRYNRNTVRWTTAAIVFSPVLAWIAYGLSWRKSQ